MSANSNFKEKKKQKKSNIFLIGLYREFSRAVLDRLCCKLPEQRIEVNTDENFFFKKKITM
jgi:hypothetical protein